MKRTLIQGIALLALIMFMSLPATAQETVFGPDDNPPTEGWWQSTWTGTDNWAHCSHTDLCLTVGKKSDTMHQTTMDILLAAQPSYIRVITDHFWGAVQIRLYNATNDTQVGDTKTTGFNSSFVCNQQYEWTGSLPQQFYIEFALDEGSGAAGDIDYVTILTDTALAVELTGFTARAAQGGVMLEWGTASEVDNAGFNIWRCESKEGEFELVTPRMIEALGGPSMAADYKFHDKTAEWGKQYYYKLEDVAYSGLSTYHGPVNVDLGFGAGKVLPAGVMP